MKKSFFTSFTGILLTSIISGIGYSQGPIAYSNDKTSVPDFILSIEEKSIEKNVAVLHLNEISSKAARDFARNFKNVSDPKWFRSKDGFIVYFTKDGMDSRAYYSRKGQYEGMILSYYEDKLAPKIRHLVKSVYYDFNICHVYELQYEDLTAHVVKLLGKTTCKTVSIVNGEMNVIDELKKQ